MVLEATMICIDGSEHMRNGDFPPTRMDQQRDAVHILSNAKTSANPESSVGLLSSGERVNLLAALTPELGKILTAVHEVPLKGNTGDIKSAIQVAALGLRHRPNRNQKQRIVVFVGSPVSYDAKDLIKLGKKLKKSSIALDIVNFGEDDNQEKLRALIDAVNNSDNSHFAHVPAGGVMLSDFLRATPIFVSEVSVDGGEASGDGAAPGPDFIAGIDPSVDPELAMALRMSMEEEEERQRRQAETNRTAAPATDTTTAQSSEPTPSPELTAAGMTSALGEGEPGSEEAMLAAALAMSMGQDIDEGGEQDDDEDEQMRLAMEMSLAGGTDSVPKGNTEDQAAVLENEEVLKSMLSSLPGVDMADSRITDALAGLRKRKPDEEGEMMEDDEEESSDKKKTQ